MLPCRRCNRVKFLMSETKPNICADCDQDFRPIEKDDKALNLGEVAIRAMYNQWWVRQRWPVWSAR